MNIRLFWKIIRDFFDSMYSQFIDINQYNIQDILDEKNTSEDDIDCGCNLCYTTRKLILYIIPGIYQKKID